MATAEVGPSRDNSGPLEDFEQFLDTVAAEIQLFSGIGRRNIDIILRDGYEYRRAKPTECGKVSQSWVCRYSTRFKCKGKLRINTADPNDFLRNAEVIPLTAHNHAPYRVNTYGCTSTTEILTSNPSSDSSQAQESGSDWHAISQLMEEDISTDFEGNLARRSSSSPIASTSGFRAPPPSLAPSADLSWDHAVVSQENPLSS